MQPRRFGRYEVLEELGRGGTAAVFRARDERLGREVAVKVLTGAQARSEEAIVRFEREARAALAVEHPGIARLLDLGVEGGTRFMVFELLAGGTLRDRLKREGPLSWREAVRHAARVADALAALHAAGFVHRDLKPANVLLDAEGRTKLADFGLARTDSADDSITSSGDVSGTAEYASPEQADGRAGDARSDLYGLGALLFALIAGVPPFEGTGFTVLKRVMTETPRDVREAASGTPAPVAALVARLLSKDPAKRGADAAAVAAELEALLDEGGGATPLVAGVLFAAGAVALALAAGLLVRGGAPAPPVPPPAPISVTAPPPALREPALAVVASWGKPAFATTFSVGAVAFVSSARILTGSESGELAFWDLPERRFVGHLRVSGARVNAISVRGPLALTAEREFMIRLWDLGTRTETATQWCNVWDPLIALSPRGVPTYSRDERTFVAGFDQKGASLEDRYPGQRIVAFDYADDGSFVLALTRAILCAKPGGERVTSLGSSDEIVALAVARNGRAFVGHPDGSITTFVPPDVTASRSWVAHPEERISALAVTPDGKNLLTGSSGPKARVVKVWGEKAWTADTPGQPRELVGHGGRSIRAIAAAPDSRTAVTSGSDGSLALWDLETGAEIGLDPRSPITAIAVSDDGAYGVSLGVDGAARVFRTSDGAPVPPFDPGPRESYTSVAFAPGSHDALAVRRDGSGATFVAGVEGWRESTPVTVDGQTFRLLAPGGAERFEVFEASGQELRGHVLSKQSSSTFGRVPARATGLAFAKPRRLLVADGTGLLHFRDAETNAESVALVADPLEPRCVAASPEGDLALTGGQSGDLVLWDTASARELARHRLGAGAIEAVAFASRDGRLALAVAPFERLLLLVETATGRELARRSFAADRDAPWCVAVAHPRGAPAQAFVGTERGVAWKLEVRGPQ